MSNATTKLNHTTVKTELNYWMENDMRAELLLNNCYAKFDNADLYAFLASVLK